MPRLRLKAILFFFYRKGKIENKTHLFFGESEVKGLSKEAELSVQFSHWYYLTVWVLRVFFFGGGGIGQMWMSGLSSYSFSIPCWCLGNRLTPWWRKSVSWWSPWLETSTLRRTARTQGSGQIHYIQWYGSIVTLYDVMQCIINWRGLYNVNKIEYNHLFTLFLLLFSLNLRRVNGRCWR